MSVRGGDVVALVEVDGTMLIIADHGNCEMMFDRGAGVPHTAHTLNAVPAILVNCNRGDMIVSNGRLADVAPTVLDLMGIAQPADMTGQSLLSQ